MRRAVGGNYKLLFSNGGPFWGPVPKWDHIQQTTPVMFQHFRKMISDDRQSLVPYGRQIPETLELLAASDRDALRRSLGLPTDRPVVLSVGALNKHHKRIDYLISEVAMLDKPRPYLLMLGQ